MTELQGQAGANPFNVVGEIPVNQVDATQVSVAPVPVPTQIQQTASVPQEGIVDKIINGIISFIAKISGQADPRTGQGASASVPTTPVASVPQAVQQPIAVPVPTPEPVVPVVEVPVPAAPVVEIPVPAPVEEEAPTEEVKAEVQEESVVESPVVTEEVKPIDPATAENTTTTVNPNQ